ncbi:MAG TPA: hypothetical protein VFA59_09535 [Vicinamibacterales bacterium]|nr:hypothetical protein [Vicinamibacterales bacterium]
MKWPVPSTTLDVDVPVTLTVIVVPSARNTEDAALLPTTVPLTVAPLVAVGVGGVVVVAFDADAEVGDVGE